MSIQLIKLHATVKEKLFKSQSLNPILTMNSIYYPDFPNVAKVGGIQSQGAKGEAVVGYCEPLATADMEPSGFPRRGKKDGENRTNPGMYHWFVPSKKSGIIINLMHIAFGEVFSIFFMQRWDFVLTALYQEAIHFRNAIIYYWFAVIHRELPDLT